MRRVAAPVGPRHRRWLASQATRRSADPKPTFATPRSRKAGGRGMTSQNAGRQLRGIVSSSRRFDQERKSERRVFGSSGLPAPVNRRRRRRGLEAPATGRHPECFSADCFASSLSDAVGFISPFLHDRVSCCALFDVAIPARRTTGAESAACSWSCRVPEPDGTVVFSGSAVRLLASIARPVLSQLQHSLCRTFGNNVTFGTGESPCTRASQSLSLARIKGVVGSGPSGGSRAGCCSRVSSRGG